MNLGLLAPSFRAWHAIARIAAPIIPLALTSVSTAVMAQAKEPTYYAIRISSDALTLVQLNSLAGEGANTSINVVDLFRRPVKSGLLVTWHLDCTSGTMNIVRGMTFSPTGHTTNKPLNSEIINRNSTDGSRLIYQLACDGRGSLLSSRTYYEDIPAIIRKFWQ